MAHVHPQAPVRIQPGAADRLGLTLFFAAALHAFVILGVSFDWQARLKQEGSPPPLEITLVHSRTDKAPDAADFLAQANQAGGGEVEEKVRPSSPFPNPRPVPQRGDARVTQAPASPRPAPPETTVIAAERAPTRVTMPRDRPDEARDNLPEAADLVSQSLEAARLVAEISPRSQVFAKKSREKFLSASTREYHTAAYEDAWRLKVERIGNLNYPDEAKLRNLTGSPILDVALKADGSILAVKVLRSSGHKALDDGAVRIVRLAAPFAPFTPAMTREFDVLHIVRAWQFQAGNQLATQ
jgi:protein TonB